MSFQPALRSADWRQVPGIALILGSIFWFDRDVAVPGLYALLPVAGTCLILVFAGPRTIAGQFLGSRLLAGMGLISYSVYLWHQPLLAFGRHRSIPALDPETALLLAAAAFLLGYLTWRYVEQPFRSRTMVSRRAIAALGVAGAASFVGIGTIGALERGFEGRFDVAQAIRTDLQVRTLSDGCSDFELGKIKSAGDWFCEAGDVNGRVTLAIFGDSHALSYLGPMDQYGKSKGVRILFSSMSACPPLRGAHIEVRSSLDKACNVRNVSAFSGEALRGVDAALLVARWSFYSIGDSTKSFRHIGDTPAVERSAEVSLRVFRSKLDETIAVFEQLGIPVAVMHQPPVQKGDATRAYWAGTRFAPSLEGALQDFSVSRADYLHWYNPLAELIGRAIAGKSGAIDVPVDDLICGEICMIGTPATAYYLDDDHLSNTGAQRIVGRIVSSLRKAGAGLPE